VVEIRLLIQHPMENGFRRDPLGRAVAKNIIHRLVARYDGREILRAELGSGIAANPYFRLLYPRHGIGPDRDRLGRRSRGAWQRQRAHRGERLTCGGWRRLR
jgi:hypothetical protein